jgi:hypothetical protein
MTYRTKNATIRRLLAKGLTGQEAGKLIVQDFINAACGKPSLLSEADVVAIQNAPMQGQDVRDYNTFMAFSRALEKGLMICDIACKDACLDLSLLITPLRDVDKQNTVELFASFGPHVVTRKQYEDIVAAQREKKLVFEYSLGYVIEERFYAIAPPEAKKEIDESGVDIESAESFVSAVPQKYATFCEQAIEEVRQLHTSGKLKAVYHDEDAKEVEPLLAKWGKDELSAAEAMKLVDMLFVTGQQLYECDELLEWKQFMDQYQQYWVSDDDASFRHAYAILEDYPETWIDENGYYKDPSPPSEWVTRVTESVLGLGAAEGEKAKSIRRVSSELREVLSRVELNARIFLAVKVILETAADAAGLDIPDEGWALSNLKERLKLYAEYYNHELSEVKEEPKPWRSGDTKLEKVLKTLPVIDLDKLMSSAASMEQFKNSILDGVRDQGWLREKAISLEYDDCFSFDKLLEDS